MKSKMILLSIIILFFNCQQNDKILKKISYSVMDGDYIYLYNFTDFEWDNVVICNPGTSKQDYINLLGNEGYSFDLTKTIIFRNNNNIVSYIRQDYHPEKPLPVEFYINTNTFKIFDKNTLFIVKKHGRNISLYPVETEN